MSALFDVLLVGAQTVILLLGGSITYYAFKAHRRTRDPALRALAVGFGLVTLGALLGGVAHQLLDVSLQTGVLVSSLLTALGFGVITYSLYVR